MSIGGTELNAVRTADRLDRSRCHISVVHYRRGPLESRYAAAGVPLLHLPLPNLYGTAAIRLGLRFRRFLIDEQIDVVHSHDLYANIFTAAWARTAGVPVVASRRWWLARPDRRRYEIPNGLAYHLAARVLANSPAVAASVRERERVSAKRVVVIPNFVDEAAFRPPTVAERRQSLRRLEVPEDALVVGIVARLDAVKDHRTLLLATSRLIARWPRLHLVIVGDGPERGGLEILARELGIAECIHFAGARPEEPNLHHLFDISVLCSRSEGFPNSLVEAMAAARPVVATAVGGNADAVTTGVSGWLVPPGDPLALAEAIERLLDSPQRRAEMGMAACRRARQTYHADVVVPMVAELYDDVAGVRSPARQE
jgi:glycosyltransferase involved in cell wall biosynthesis